LRYAPENDDRRCGFGEFEELWMKKCEGEINRREKEKGEK
jgi:hypothetical protein